MYCSLNDGGWLTERQWDRWEKRNELEKLEIRTKFQLETMKGKSSLGELGLDEMLKTKCELDINDYNSR